MVMLWKVSNAMRVIVLLLFLILPRCVAAEWVNASGSQLFPPSVAEAVACQQADDRARMDAIRQVAGERLSAQDWQMCREDQDQSQCLHNAVIWVDLGGVIRALRNRQVVTLDDVAGYRRCMVRFEADIVVPTAPPDPNFNLGVTLNAALFRPGEALKLALTPTQPMWVQIYQWLPYEAEAAQVRRIFPNSRDANARIDHTLILPGAGYEFKVALPQGTSRSVDEYLLIISSRKSLSLQETYSLADFTRLVAELAPQDSRLVRRAYTIMGEK